MVILRMRGSGIIKEAMSKRQEGSVRPSPLAGVAANADGSEQPVQQRQNTSISPSGFPAFINLITYVYERTSRCHHFW